ncbi:MAG: hypothetical protein DHS20C14_06190 [Phycisphaeraceae bacterium]|nr:MAG: hypothetical protein DHS20C14_06190 [Phycisphaeraceae bacterium]
MPSEPARALYTPDPMPDTQPDTTPAPDPTPGVGDPLPEVAAPLAPPAVLDTLERLSKRGKLAGFRRIDARTFGATAYGNPFDRELVGTADAAGEGSRVGFALAWKRKLPGVFLATLVLSAWPGVHLMDSLMNTWFGWYPNAFWVTCAWYLPLTVLPAPWAWSVAMKRSRRSSDEHAREQIEKIRAALTADG